MSDVSNDRSPPMYLRDPAEVDGKCQLNQRSLRQAKVRRFNEHPIGAQITGSTELSFATGHCKVDRRASSVPCVKTPFHREAPAIDLLDSDSDSGTQYAAWMAVM